MSFNNSGNITAGTLNQVEGNQTIGGHQYGAVTDAEARTATASLRTALAGAHLPSSIHGELSLHLDEVEAEVSKQQPDRGKAARALHRVTTLLSSVGALTRGGSTLLDSLRTLIRWLGLSGSQLAQLLPTE